MKRALLIVNPYSTQVTGERIGAVEDVLRERVERRDRVHAAARLTPPSLPPGCAGGVDAIVVFSGDGTYNEALNGADGAVPFGFLPGGGTSVLPRALGLPRDPVAAARAVGAALAEGRARRISLGTVERPALLLLGRHRLRRRGGAACSTSSAATRRARVPGDIAFRGRWGGWSFERRGKWDPQLEIEGVGRAAFVLVANGDPYSYAGSLPMHVDTRRTVRGRPRLRGARSACGGATCRGSPRRSRSGVRTGRTC